MPSRSLRRRFLFLPSTGMICFQNLYFLKGEFRIDFFLFFVAHLYIPIINVNHRTSLRISQAHSLPRFHRTLALPHCRNIDLHDSLLKICHCTILNTTYCLWISMTSSRSCAPRDGRLLYGSQCSSWDSITERRVHCHDCVQCGSPCKSRKDRQARWIHRLVGVSTRSLIMPSANSRIQDPYGQHSHD